MESLLKSLDTNRPTLLPQMRVLEESHLIVHYNDSYELTTLGKIVIDKMLPLLDTLEVFDVDIDYWGAHGPQVRTGIPFVPTPRNKGLQSDRTQRSEHI